MYFASRSAIIDIMQVIDTLYLVIDQEKRVHYSALLLILVVSGGLIPALCSNMSMSFCANAKCVNWLQQ